MIIIDVTKEKSLDAALKKYKSKVIKTKQIQQLRDRQQYLKPSVKKRNVVQKAVYHNQKNQD